MGAQRSHLRNHRSTLRAGRADGNEHRRQLRVSMAVSEPGGTAAYDCDLARDCSALREGADCAWIRFAQRADSALSADAEIQSWLGAAVSKDGGGGAGGGPQSRRDSG